MPKPSNGAINTTTMSDSGLHPPEAVTDSQSNGSALPDRVHQPQKGESASILRSIRWSAYAGIVMFGLIILIFSIWIPDVFLTSGTAKSIAATQALIAILALGLLPPLAAGVYDLSSAQCLGLSAVVCAWLLTSPKVSIPLAIVITLGLGLAIGLLNAFLVAVVGLDSFIATLGSTSLLFGMQQKVANGAYVGPVPDKFGSMTAGDILGIPKIAVYMLIIAVILWYVLEHTPIGRKVYATGSNRDAARLAGLRTTAMIFWSMVASGVVASVAGILYASTIGTTNQNDGPPYLLPAFAAAFLGATMIKVGVFNVWGTLLAVYLLGTGVTGLQLAGGPVWLTAVFNGAALIIAVSIALIGERLRGRNAISRLVRSRRRAT